MQDIMNPWTAAVFPDSAFPGQRISRTDSNRKMGMPQDPPVFCIPIFPWSDIYPLLLAGIGMHIKLRVKRIEIPAVQFILGNPQALAKPLVMDHFTRP